MTAVYPLNAIWRSLLLVALLTSAPSYAAGSTWEEFVWQGEKAFASTSGEWTAVVSQPRGRLVYFGERATGRNLLYAPLPLIPSLSWGGHRFWLGPQNSWSKMWPPPADWEYRGAEVTADGETLSLKHPRSDIAYPALSRTYRWEAGSLICAVSWDASKVDAKFAIQIFQVPADATVTALRNKSKDLPEGFAALTGDKVVPGTKSSQVSEKGDNLIFRRLGHELKAGLEPQTLYAKEGNLLLSLSRGAFQGTPNPKLPDGGLLSQVYLGSDASCSPFVELEQLTPFLTSESGSPASFQVALSARKIDSADPFSTLSPTPAAEHLAVEIPAADPRIRYLGRFEMKDPQSPRFAWSGCAISAAFKGSALNAEFSASGLQRFQIMIDGHPQGVLNVSEGEGVYRVVSGLEVAVVHQVTLIKATEALFGMVRFKGFQVELGAGLQALPAPLTRRIEFIGDSITAGYGNEGPFKESHLNPATENFCLTYGYLTGQALSAEVVSQCWTGRCLISASSNDGMPELSRRTLPEKPTSVWNYQSWQPDAVIINLGTNDFSGKPPEESKWADSYRPFIKDLRDHYPNAHLVLTIGPMLDSTAIDQIRNYNDRLVAECRKAGDGRVHSFAFSPQNGHNGLGSDWHPNTVTHLQMAQELEARLKEFLNW